MCSAYPGRRATLRLSSIGMLAPKNIAVIAAGPTIVHHHDASAATPKSHSPHQKPSSPR